jgi:hypothetical protein
LRHCLISTHFGSLKVRRVPSSRKIEPADGFLAL